MLLRVILENFLSFREPVQFDMFPNPKRSIHPSHIYRQEIPVLKMAAVYGANGSGKSNLVKGLKFIHDFVSDNVFTKHSDITSYLHKGNPAQVARELTLTVEFCAKGRYFIYSFTISSERVISESLYLSGLGKSDNTLIFKREGDSIVMGIPVDPQVKVAIDKLLSKNPTESLIRLNEQFPIVPGTDMQLASRWLQHKLVVIPFDAVAQKLIDMLDSDPDLMRFTNEVMSKIGLGVSDISIKEEAYDEWIKKKSHRPFQAIPSEIEEDKVVGVTKNKRQMFIAKKDNDKTVVKEFVFRHTGSEGRSFEMDITGESDGTVRLLNLVPAFYDAMETNATIIVDEIDHSVHPILSFALVKFFAESATKGQLIFTTHETCLLDQKVLLRPDEVWFAEKSEGATRLYSLNDFKEHNTISVENGYINGRYGAIPYIGDIEWLR